MVTVQTTKRDGLIISYLDEEEFEGLWDEIFRANLYIFSSKTAAPLIIDCGANIGMSVLYFKKLYPQARIIAFEPHPQIFEILAQNIKQNHLQDVQLVNAAVGQCNGEISFYVRHGTTKSTGDTTLKEAIIGSEELWSAITVPAVRLSSYITEPVDYLKLDIEGMEEIILREIEHKLSWVREIRAEFHCKASNKANNLDRAILLLARHHFKCAFASSIGGPGKVLRIDKIRRNMLECELYYVIIYVHRSQLYVWRQSWFVPNYLRVKNKVKRMTRRVRYASTTGY